jgi:chorismate mutase
MGRLSATPGMVGIAVALGLLAGTSHPAGDEVSSAPARRGAVAAGGTGLSDFRATLDNLDAVLLRLLAERSRVLRQMGDYRRKHHLPAHDESWDQRHAESLVELAGASGLDAELVRRLFQLLNDGINPGRDTPARRGTVREGAARKAPAVRELEASLDNLDTAVVRLLAERFRTTQKVGEYKRQNGLPARDEARESGQLERARGLAASVGLDPEVAQRVFRMIFDAVVANHERLRQPSLPRP